MKPVTFPPAVTGDSGERLLTVREVADVLGLGPRTVRDYVARGELSGSFGQRGRAANVNSRPGDSPAISTK
jgi:excisionase family DNA binding protein